MKAGHIAAAMCLTLVTGCGLQAVVTAPTPTSTDTAIVPVPTAAMPGRQLPDGVPLPPGALLVSGPTDTKARGQVTGWAAIATQSSDASGAQTRTFLRSQLALIGWALSEPPVRGGGWTVTAERQMVLGGEPTAQWLQVSVTEPLSSSGPAITYRFVSSPAGAPAGSPTDSPAPTVSAGGRR